MSSTLFVFWLLRLLLFVTAAVGVSLYALRNGGQPERLVAAMVLVAAALTILLPRSPFAEIVWPLLVIDGAMLFGLVLVAMWADRFWPLYLAAVHLLAVTLHGVRAYDASILPDVYARLGGLLAYPVLAILALGTWRHRRRRPELDWSWQVRRERAVAGAAGG